MELVNSTFRVEPARRGGRSALASQDRSLTVAGLKELREAVDKTVGSVFYGTVLKAMRNSAIKGAYGHGGRGEEVFQAQLHQLLSERAGAAKRFDLNEAMFNRLADAQLKRVAANSRKGGVHESS